MSTDLGAIGYGSGSGSWASGSNSYAAGTSGVSGVSIPDAASSPQYPYIRKPNGGKRDFNFQDVNGGSNVSGARVFLREHYSQQQIGPIRITDASGDVSYKNLDTSSDVYYTLYAIHPSSAGFNAAIADWLQANPG